MEDKFKKTEGILYSHFKRKQKIMTVSRSIEEIEKKIEKNKKDIETTNISIPLQSSAMSYEERVQTSPSGDGYAEKELERQISKLEQNIVWLEDRKVDKRVCLDKLEIEVKEIDSVLENLDEEELRFVELKYGDKKGIEQISQCMSMARTTVYRKRKNIVEKISNLIVWEGEECKK